jgi:hypothetical protein
MAEKGMVERLGDKFLFAVYILEERRKASKDQEFGPYLDTLPVDFCQYPLYYNDEELKHLKGSPVIDHLNDFSREGQDVYESICREIPEFKDYKIEDFFEVMQLCFSRSFGLQIDDKYITCLVPYADMGNHNLPQMTYWNYNAEREGFVVVATRDIKKGEEVTLCYGENITNVNWFLQYGFVYQPN